MAILPSVPKNTEFMQVMSGGVIIGVCFPTEDKLVCHMGNGNCIGRLMTEVNKQAHKWYLDYITGGDNEARK